MDFENSKLNAATATVLDNCNDIINYLVDHITDPGAIDYYMRFYETMDRLWFNEVTDTANNAKLNDDIVGPRIKAFFPAVKSIQ